MKYKFSARVKNDDGEWIDFDPIRWINLDENGCPVSICGPTGLQYTEFKLNIEEKEVIFAPK